MSAPLARLLKIRRILEESSRMELEGRTALVARIDGLQGREREKARVSRERALAKISEGGPASVQAEERALEWSSVERALWRERQLEPLARAASQRAAESREEFFSRRKERRQVESVLEAELARRRMEEERRIQRDLDDWFGMRRERWKSRGAARDSENSLSRSG